MKRILLIIADIVLGAVALAVITNVIADYMTIPLWAAIVICIVAVGGLIAVSLSLRQVEPEGLAPPYTPPTLPGPEVLPKPGRLPPGSRVAFGRNKLFTGRERALRELARRLLHGDGGSALVTQAVAGMGGVGKTQLAVEFAYRYGRFFHGVHWLNAGRAEGLSAEVAACGEQMCLPGWPEKLPEQVARTLEAWRWGGRRLVVLDNLEEVRAAWDWLGRLSGGGARVLVTARRSDWPADLGLEVLRLEVFTREESRAFLRRYLGEGRATDEEVGRLAERLGRLPLALQLAGRYLEGYPTLSVGAYLGEFGDVLSHISMREWDEEMGSPTGYDLNVMATFELSWKRVKDEGVCRVFQLAGYCAPNQPIPDDLLRRASELDDKGYGRAVHVLTGLGLLRGSETGPVVHPLLGEYARAVAAEGEEAGVLGAVAGALGTLAEEAITTELPARFAPLRPHLEAVAPVAEAAELGQTGELWNELGRQLRRLADYASAQVALERAVAIDERVFGPEHPQVVTDVNNLGLVLRDLGDLAGARECFERALGIWRAAYGEEHPQVATAHNNLGLVLWDLGDLAGARESFERALAIDEQVFGPEHPEVATDVNNLGLVLKDLGDLAGARESFERALAIDERVLGPENPKVARDVNNLGLVRKDLGDLAGARECIERALGIDERVLGPEHPNVARDVNNLGLVLKDLGDLAGAGECLERALRIREEVYGREHPDTGLSLWWLGTLARDAGDVQTARGYFKEALRTFEKVYPADHPRIGGVRRDLESLRE